MKKNIIFILITILIIIGIIITFTINLFSEEESSQEKNGVVKESNTIEDDFQIDMVFTSEEGRDIHYSAYIPENIDELDYVFMFITLPGWEGLYFQGVGVNLEYEDFAFAARDINKNMIILAPQLDDWGEQSAEDTIALTKYYQETYNIDKTYIEGYSGGGETLSLVLDKNADLYDSALMVSSQWDGGYDAVVEEELPLYFFIGEEDDYYGSSNFKETYQEIYDLYREKGLSKQQIDDILILDVRGEDYFTNHGYTSQHAGGGEVAHEVDIMKWLLTR